MYICSILTKQNFNMRQLSLVPLTDEELKTKVPAAFSTKAASSTSAKYRFVSTIDVINALKKMGFNAVDARQKHLRQGPIHFQKHYITFVHPDHVLMNENGLIEEILQIHIINSHNGTSLLSLNVSLYRLVCENGMLGLGKNFVDLTLRHMGFDEAELNKKIQSVLSSVPQLEKLVKDMKRKELSEEVKKKLAKEMAVARFGEERTKKIDLDKLLTPLRPEDAGNGLWNVFNLVQEKLIRGGEYNESGKKVRAYTNFELQMGLNESIFKVAEAYL